MQYTHLKSFVRALKMYSVHALKTFIEDKALGVEVKALGVEDNNSLISHFYFCNKQNNDAKDLNTVLNNS